MRYYLAYGSNLNRGQMRRRCPDAKAVGTAWIENYELLFKGSGSGAYLTIEKKKGARVPVAVWQVSERDEENLDVYEGCPRFYYKKPMKIRLNGTIKDLNAFVYIMHEDRELGIPSRYYMETCEQGYRNFLFDVSYLWGAFFKTRERITA